MIKILLLAIALTLGVTTHVFANDELDDWTERFAEAVRLSSLADNSEKWFEIFPENLKIKSVSDRVNEIIGIRAAYYICLERINDPTDLEKIRLGSLEAAMISYSAIIAIDPSMKESVKNFISKIFSSEETNAYEMFLQNERLNEEQKNRVCNLFRETGEVE